METKQIKFCNTQNPKSKFDLVDLEEVFRRKHHDHSPTELHRVEFYIIILIESGQGGHTIDFTNYPCSQGTLLTIRKDQIHKFWGNSNLKGRMLLFTDEFLVSYLEEMESKKTLLLFNELLSEPTLQLSTSEFEIVSKNINRIQQEYFDTNDHYSLSIIRSELHILITLLFRIKAQQGKVAVEKKYLKEFIEFQRLVEKNAIQITKVKEYAHMLGLSTKTLNTISKSIVNKSAKEFIDEIRTKQIKRLLINSALSIKEIAYQSGFEESTNFYKYFKRQTQSTPEQFRATH